MYLFLPGGQSAHRPRDEDGDEGDDASDKELVGREETMTSCNDDRRP